MREKLLDILKCPACGSSSFSLKKNEEDCLEIKNGNVLCRHCRASYRIEEGILNFLNNAPEPVLRERNAMDKDDYLADEDGNKFKITPGAIEMLKDKFLSFPEGDGSYFFKSGGSFQSIAEASDRFYSTLDYMCLTGKEKMLEIGSCFSYASFKFAEKGCKVVAIDISNYLKASGLFAKVSYFDRIFSDMHNMPFMDNGFDIVFGSAVLHHSKDLKKVFNEICRVLRPGGRLILINESARGIFEKVSPAFEEINKRGFGDTSYTIKEWKKGAVQGGFKRVKVEFLSLADDYVTKHKKRGSKINIKLRIAHFIMAHRILEGFLLFLLIPLRVLFRPRSWRLVCYK